jgi:hypothetical protein
MFATTIQSQGLPGPEGVTREAGERFEFSLCLAEQNGNRWLLGIPSLREDRVTYLPTSEAQGAWVDEQSDLMVPAGLGLSWWFHDACAAFEFVERLGPCRQGATLQERYLEQGHDLIAPPRKTAEELLGRAQEALGAHACASAFDLATRLLVAEGFRLQARRLRWQVLLTLGCADAAAREQGILDLLGAPKGPGAPPSPAPLPLPVAPGHRAVAVELQGLPLRAPAIENALSRYLFRLDVPPAGPLLVRFPLTSALEPERPEQANWLPGAGATCVGTTWSLRDDDAVERFVSAAQASLRGLNRWSLSSRIRRAREEGRCP